MGLKTEMQEGDTHKLFQHSLLPASVQRNLVDEISDSLMKVLAEESTDTVVAMRSGLVFHIPNNREDIYIVTGRRYNSGAVNVPFTFAKDTQRFSLEYAHIVGPLEPELVPFVTYVDQEAAVLIAQAFNQEAQITTGTRHLVAYGQGLSRLAGQLGAQGSSRLRHLPVSQLVAQVAQEQRDILTHEVVEYKGRYDMARSSYRYGPDSSTYVEYEETIDRLKGFNEGVLLLDELSAVPWIQE